MITDKELLELIDGNLSMAEADEVRKVIDRDPEVKKRFELLTSVNTILAEQTASRPSGTFTESVMSNLNKRLAINSIDNNSFWKKNLFVVGLIVVIGLVAAITLLSNFSLSDLLPALKPQEITLTERTISFDPGKLNFFDQDLFIKGIIYMNAFVALFLLEKAVLRPLFRQRRQNYSF